MNNFYNLESALKIEKIKKRQTLIQIIVGLLVLVVVILLVILKRNVITMIINSLLVGSYFSYILFYQKVIKKNLNASYHFLAKIQQFDHEIMDAKIISIDDVLKTIDNFEVYEIKLDNNRNVFIECNKVNEDIKIDNNLKLEIVDNFIIGYEVLK